MPDTQHALVKTLLHRYGRTYAEEVGVRVEDNTPSALFQLLYMALLLSARIAAGNAVKAAIALRKAGLTTPQKMADASWQERVDVITWHGYKRYDESTSTMLGKTAQWLLDQYKGDLRRLRQAADHRVDEEKKLLKQFKGIGDVGADIFLREVQGTWDEVYPYADKKVLASAGKLGLPQQPERLAEMVARKDFPKFAAALIRVDLERAHKAVQDEAGR
ncbi:hypothetical protein [Thiohalomonas denitrificans]|uniref:hypothetical protein n=1 Tax=Thiohalomonas denitrificans TaxID=415747 RepID=UPI0026EC09D7|nr:hypothetical protein [Thiohalomonas denitrificans]